MNALASAPVLPVELTDATHWNHRCAYVADAGLTIDPMEWPEVIMDEGDNEFFFDRLEHLSDGSVQFACYVSANEDQVLIHNDIR